MSSASNPFVSTQFLRSCSKLDQLPVDGAPEIAFVGRSNAGKSSALNRLCGQRALARVSKTPGRTQLINLFEVAGGRFVDLPGYGYAKVSADVRQEWGRLIGQFMEKRANLVGLVLIMDVRHPLTDLDRQMLEWCVQRQLHCHVLLTKADKLGFGAAKNTLLSVQRQVPALSTVTVQLFSAPTGQGLEELTDTVQKLLQAAPDGHPDSTAEGA